MGIASSIGGRGTGGNVTLLASALPSLLVALVSVVLSSLDGVGEGYTEPAGEQRLPVTSDDSPALARGAAIALCMATIAAATLWMSLYALHVSTSLAGAGGMFLAMGCGALAAHHPEGLIIRTLGGLAVLCGGAGLILGGAGVVMSQGWLQWPGGMGAVACASLVVLSFSAASGREMILHRVARRSSEGASMLGRSLLGGALMVALLIPALSHWNAYRQIVVALAVSLLLLSGVLALNDPTVTRRARRTGVGALIGSILLLMTLTTMTSDRVPQRADSLAATGVSPAGG
jgi:hypothetical protein